MRPCWEGKPSGHTYPKFVHMFLGRILNIVIVGWSSGLNPPLRIICLTKNHFGTQPVTQIDSTNQCHVCQYVPLKSAFTLW